MMTAGQADAAEFTPYVSAAIAYADNVRLDIENAEDDMVYSLQPGLRVNHESQRFTANLDYLLQAFHYDDLSETEVFHNYTANANVDIVPEEFFLAFGARRFQSIVDPGQPIPNNNLPLTANRVDRDDYFVTPSFVRRLGASVTATGQYNQTWVEIAGRALQNNTQSTGQFALDNYAAGEGITWALNYNWRRLEYGGEGTQPFENQIAQLELGFWLSRRTRIFVSGGLESEWESPLDPALEAEIWEAGVSYTPRADMQLVVAAGERSFGSSGRVTLNFATRRGTFTLAYLQQPTTQGFQRFDATGPSEADLIDDLLTAQGQSQRFVSNRLNFNYTLALRRLTFRARAFVEDRTDVTTALGDVLPDQEQYSVGLQVNYQLGARTTAGIQVSQASRNAVVVGDAPNRDIRNVIGTLGYTLGARTQLSLLYNYGEQEAPGSTPDDTQNIFTNTVSLTVRREF